MRRTPASPGSARTCARASNGRSGTRGEVVERIARGQAYIDEKHSAEAVARFWLDVLDSKT
jgi:hypothetical protein